MNQFDGLIPCCTKAHYTGATVSADNNLMSHNTIALNKQRQKLDHLDSVWLFAYGSLMQ